METGVGCSGRDKVPYLLLNGNHDTEQDLSYQEITHFITSARNCLNKANEEGVLADMVLEIKGEQGTSAEALIYGIDSHSNSLLPQVDGYAWINYDQIAWYRSQSNQYKAKNGGKALPSLAFFIFPWRNILRHSIGGKELSVVSDLNGNVLPI